MPRKVKGFRTIPNRPLWKSLEENARPSSLNFLPAPYPFWTRHAAFTGMTYLDYNSSVISRVSVVIDTTDGGHNFAKTPLVLTWVRDSDSSLNYTTSTAIYKFPIIRRNSSGVAIESFNTSFFSATNQLYFVRHSITAFGTSATKRVYIKFFLFDDDPFLNPNTTSTSALL